MSNSLLSVVPTEDERRRMVSILSGLGERLLLREGTVFAPPVYNESNFTYELRWVDGSREWVSAWVHDSPSRNLVVWRHPSYRYESDRRWLDTAVTDRNLNAHDGLC